MTDTLDILLDYLKGAEGNTIHYNDGEVDITSPYGIYRAEHPNAKIFKYIDTLAEEIGIEDDSRDWSKSEIDELNEYIFESEERTAKIRSLAKEFYKAYLEKARLQYFNKDLVVLLFSIFVNSQRGYWKTIQRTLNYYIKTNQISHSILVEDGYFGRNTREALEQLKALQDSGAVTADTLKFQILYFMQVFYVELSTNNKKRYFKYLKGWKNRLLNLV